MLRRTLNLGILAHVDAGKTTLTERLLYAAGVIDEIGSVDDGSTQTDTLALERQRGITIKSAVVSFPIDDVTINLIDTPGHPDFIAEVERVLSVLDGAVLVISAVEGVQSQTPLLMRALQRLGVPTLLFVNKVDRRGADCDRVVRGDLSKTDERDRSDGIGGQHGDFGSGWSRCSPSATKRSSSAYVGDEDIPYDRLCDRTRGADEAGARAPGVLRLGDHGRGRGRAHERHRAAAASCRRGLRRPALGHRLQDRARPGGREGRLCPDVLGRAARARSSAGRRGRAQGDRPQRLRQRLGRSRRFAGRAPDRKGVGARRDQDRRRDRRTTRARGAPLRSADAGDGRRTA